MATTATLGGLNLLASPYNLSEPIDDGRAAIADALLTGDLRPEEYDQYAAEQRLVRQVVLSINIRSGTFAQSVADTQAIIAKLTGASRYAPVDFVFTPNGGNQSTFKVIGGSLDAPIVNQQVNLGTIRQATLTLDCLPFVYGVAQSLGSSGSPLLALGTQTPATVTLAPSPAGGVPGDVVLFVRNDATLTQTVQTVVVNATGGSFSLNWGGLAASYTTVQGTAVATVNTGFRAYIDNNDVTVTGTPNNYTFTFSGSLAYNQYPLIGDASALTGGTHSITVTPIGTTPAPIRSLIVGGVSSNTTWTPSVDQSTWTLDTAGSRSGGQVLASPAAGAVSAVAHFAAPTLPSDRRFRLFLQAGQQVQGNVILFRVRVVSGSVQATGEWRSLPQELDDAAAPYATALADMGAWTFPVGSVGALGAQGTTVYVESLALGAPTTVAFSSALFVPDDSMLVCETSDTSLTLEASGGYVRVESDNVYDSSGNPLGAVTTGSHLRTLGGRYVVATSQGFGDTIDPATPWAGEKASAWASYTPRYLGLA